MRNLHIILIACILCGGVGSLSACRSKSESVNSTTIGGILVSRIPTTSFVPGSRGDPQSLDSNPTTIPSFHLGSTEITTRQFCEFLNAFDKHSPTTFPLLAYSAGRWSPRANFADIPMTSITFRDAKAFCRWFSKENRCSARLPTELEWEAAARAGIHQAPFAWGWGSPNERAVWCTSGASKVGRFPPNGFGLYDMSGNVYEWCTPSAPIPKDQCVVRGGAWSETDSRFLTVYRRTLMAHNYRGTDTGFRISVR